jgi:uncharacterized metal-binding protein
MLDLPMPSGRTHDSITLWSLPLLAGLTLGVTKSGTLALLVSGAFLFSGLMFGPDLDIHSQQYKRWGVLRWIWLPYRKSMRHRSRLSHGFLLGTIGRMVYLAIWLAGFGSVFILASAIVQYGVGLINDWQASTQQMFFSTTQFLLQTVQRHPQELAAVAIGCELGAMSHSLSDWIGSALKRWQKRKNTARKR